MTWQSSQCWCPNTSISIATGRVSIRRTGVIGSRHCRDTARSSLCQWLGCISLLGRELSTTSRLHACEVIHVKALAAPTPIPLLTGAGMRRLAAAGSGCSLYQSGRLHVTTGYTFPVSKSLSLPDPDYPTPPQSRGDGKKTLPETISNMPTENTAYQSLGSLNCLDLVRLSNTDHAGKPMYARSVTPALVHD